MFVNKILNNLKKKFGLKSDNNVNDHNFRHVSRLCVNTANPENQYSYIKCKPFPYEVSNRKEDCFV